MSMDPASIFGTLLLRCIREDAPEKDRMVTESLAVAILGFLSSVATTYALGLIGVL